MATKNGAITREQLKELLSKDSHWLAAEREDLNRLHESKTTAQTTIAERHKTIWKHSEADIKPSSAENREELQGLATENGLHLDQKSNRQTEIDLLLANHTKGKERLKTFEIGHEESRTWSENWRKLNEVFGAADGAKFTVLV